MVDYLKLKGFLNQKVSLKIDEARSSAIRWDRNGLVRLRTDLLEFFCGGQRSPC